MLHNSWDILLAQINQARGPRVGSPSLGKEGSYLYLRSQNKSLTKMTKCHIPSRQPPAQVSEEQSPTWLYNSVCPGDVLPQGRSNAQKNKGQGLCSCPPPPHCKDTAVPSVSGDCITAYFRLPVLGFRR